MKLVTHRPGTKPMRPRQLLCAWGRVWGFPDPASQTARQAVVCQSRAAGSERRTRLAGEVCLSRESLSSSGTPGVEGDSSF